jgi:uncharacterized protein YfiM (DUF2279 family)
MRTSWVMLQLERRRSAISWTWPALKPDARRGERQMLRYRTTSDQQRHPVIEPSARHSQGPATSVLVCLILAGVVIGLARDVGAEDRWLARDKAEHAAASAAIGAGGYALAATVTERPKWRVILGTSAAVGAGTAKELWDKSHGEASWRDFSWDVIGASAGVAIAWAVDRAFRHRRQAQPGRAPAWRIRQPSRDHSPTQSEQAVVPLNVAPPVAER